MGTLVPPGPAPGTGPDNTSVGGYYSPFTVTQITALAQAFTNEAQSLQSQVDAMNNPVVGMTWSGEAYDAAMQAWEAIGVSLVVPTITACQQVAASLNSYAQAIQSYQQQMAQQVNVADIAGLVQAILVAASIFLAPFAAPALGAIGTFISDAFASLPGVITDALAAAGSAIAPFTPVLEFAYAAGEGTALSLVTSVIDTAIYDSMTGQPFQISGSDLAQAALFGAATGGLGYAEGVVGERISDPASMSAPDAVVAAPPAVRAAGADAEPALTVAGEPAPEVVTEPVTGIADPELSGSLPAGLDNLPSGLARPPVQTIADEAPAVAAAPESRPVADAADPLGSVVPESAAPLMSRPVSEDSAAGGGAMPGPQATAQATEQATEQAADQGTGGLGYAEGAGSVTVHVDSMVLPNYEDVFRGLAQSGDRSPGFALGKEPGTDSWAEPDQPAALAEAPPAYSPPAYSPPAYSQAKEWPDAGGDPLGLESAKVTEKAMLDALRGSSPELAEIKLPVYTADGPEFGPDLIGKLYRYRTSVVEQEIDARPRANPFAGDPPQGRQDAEPGAGPGAGADDPAAAPVEPLPQVSDAERAQAEIEMMSRALARNEALRDALMDGVRPAAIWKPDGTQGERTPPGRFGEVSRLLDDITAQRRALLSERSGLGHPSGLGDDQGPLPELAAGRRTQIDAELKKLDDVEAGILAERDRRWGEPRVGDTRPALPATSKNEVLAELRKVVAERQSVLRLRNSHPGAGDLPPPDASPAALTALDAREASMLQAARTMDVQIKQAELRYLAKQMEEVTGQRGLAQQDFESALARHPPAIRQLRRKLAEQQAELSEQRGRLLGSGGAVDAADTAVTGSAPPAEATRAALTDPTILPRLSLIATRQAEVAAGLAWLDDIAGRKPEDAPADQERAPAEPATAQLRAKYYAAGRELNELTRSEERIRQGLRGQLRSLLGDAGRELPTWVLPVPPPRTADDSATPAAGRRSPASATVARAPVEPDMSGYVAAQLSGIMPVPAEALRPAPAGAVPVPGWEDVLARHPLPDPGVFDLAHVKAGVIVHGPGAALTTAVRAQAAAIEPDTTTARVLIDPWTADLRALDGYLRLLPDPVRSVLTIEALPGVEPLPAPWLGSLATYLGLPVGARPGHLAGAAVPGPNLIPLDELGRRTGPEEAVAYVFWPAKPAAGAPRPGKPGDAAAGPGRRRVRFDLTRPERIDGGWHFPRDGDDPAVKKAADHLPAFPGHTVIAVHFNSVTGRFEADGRSYDFSEFGERLRELPGWVAGQPVILVACVIGLAAELSALARAAGSDVITGAHDVWVTAGGEVVSVPAVIRSGVPAPYPRHQSEWLHVPAGGGQVTSYRGTLPKVMKQVAAARPVRMTQGTGRWPLPGRDVRFSVPTTTGLAVPGLSHFGGTSGSSRRSSTSSVRTGEDTDADDLVVPERELPPGFGVVVDSVRTYPMGFRGRFESLGEVRLSEDRELGDLVARALPPGTGLEGPVAAQVTAFLAEHGSHEFVQRLLEDGLDFEIVTGSLRRRVTANLDLGDPALWSHLRQHNPDNQPVGQKNHIYVEAPEELIGSPRTTLATTGGLTVTANALVPAGHVPNDILQLTAGIKLEGGFSNSYTTGNDVVAAAKRHPQTSGATAYFDFPGAAIVTSVWPAGRPDLAVPGWLDLSARAGFPLEMCPLKRPGDPPGAFRPQPRTLPGTGLIGVLQEDLDRAAPGDPVWQAAERVHDVLSRFLVTPESAGGLQQVRRDVNRALTSRGGTLDPKVSEGVAYFLSEPSFLRMWGELVGPGAVSQRIVGDDGEAYLIVTSRLRNVRPATDDHVEVKEEVQRFINVPDNKTEGMTASIGPTLKTGVTIGDPDAPPGGNSTVSGGLDFAPIMSTSRSENANTGSGDIRGLVFHGNSRLYRADMSVTTELFVKGEARGTRRPISRNVDVWLRVPEAQHARFEAMLAEAADPIGRPIPVDDQPDEEESLRNPPEALAAGQGIGFSGVGHISGNVLPWIKSKIWRAEKGLPWVRKWTALDDAVLHGQLTPWLSGSALKSHANALFQPAGVRFQLFRPALLGNEKISVRVWATHAATPKTSGRFEEVTLEVMPSAFAGNYADETVGLQLGVTLQAQASIGVSTQDKVTGLGFGGQASASHTRTLTTGAEASGFGLEAVLYEGPVRYYDYDIIFHADVSVERELGTKLSDALRFSLLRLPWWVLRQAWRGLRFGWNHLRRAIRGGDAEPAGSVTDDDDDIPAEIAGSVRFVIPEGLTRTEAETDPASIAATGVSETHLYHTPRGPVVVRDGEVYTEAAAVAAAAAPAAGPAGARAGTRLGAIRALLDGLTRNRRGQEDFRVILPDVRPFLGSDGNHAITTEDQVIGLTGTSEVGRVLEQLLLQAGMSRDSFAHLVPVVTAPDFGAAALVRGPARHQFTIDQPHWLGLYSRRAEIRLETFITDVKDASSEPVDLFQMRVDEGDVAVSAVDTSSWVWSYSGWGLWNLVTKTIGSALRFVGLLDQEVPGQVSYGRQYTWTRTLTDKRLPTSGRLIQALHPYREKVGRAVWRISVVAYNRNFAFHGNPKDASAIVDVKRGISFARRVNQAPDPRAARGPVAPETLPPGTVPAIKRANPKAAEPPPGTRLLPQIPGSPRDRRLVPVVPIVPALAVTKRLYPVIPAPEAAGPPDVTGEGNPLYDAVRNLLEEHAPKMLHAYWTIEHGAVPRRRREIPARLQNLLNVSSLTMLMDAMLGPGLLLSAIRQITPWATEHVQIRLRARRDPDGEGYTFLATEEEANVSRYAFGLNIANEAKSKVRENNPTWQVSPEVASVAAPASGAGAGAATGAPAGGFSTFEPTGNPGVTKSTTRGGYAQNVKAQRDTWFIPGRAGLYGGKVEIDITLSRSIRPSWLLHSALMTLPGKIAGLWWKTGDHDAELPHESVVMYEAVLIPADLLDDTIPPVPAGAFAVEELAPGTPLPADALNLLPDEWLNRKVVTLGWNHESLRLLFEEVVRKLAASDPSVRRLTDKGTVAYHALHHIFSYQMFTRELEKMVGADGLTMPLLVRQGGPLTDTSGEVNIKVTLAGPQVRGYIFSWLESVGYRIGEIGGMVARAFGWSPGADTSFTGNTGNLAVTSPVSPAKQQVTGAIGPTASWSSSKSNSHILQNITRAKARSRRIPWLDVIPGRAIVTVKVTTWNQRGIIKVPAGEVTVSYLLRNAVDLAFSPEAALAHNVYPAEGMPTPAGRYFPSPGDDGSALAAAFNMRLFTNDNVAARTAPEGRVDPRHRAWYQVAGYYDYWTDSFHIGHVHEAGAPFPEGFEPPESYTGPRQFRGGAYLNDVEFAAHLWGVIAREHQHARKEAPLRMPNMVLASSLAGAPSNRGASAFARRVSGYLRNHVLASPAHVYHSPLGRTLSVNYGFDELGNALMTTGSLPPADRGLPDTSSQHPWRLFSNGEEADVALGHDLHQVITAELPGELRARAARLGSPPPSRHVLLGPHRQRRSSPLAQDVRVIGGLRAGPSTLRPDTVVIRRPGETSDPHDSVVIRAMRRPTPETVNIYLTRAAVGNPEFGWTDFLPALEEVAGALPPEITTISLHGLDAWLISDPLSRTRLAAALAVAGQRTVRVGNGHVRVTPHGLLVHDDANPAASIWQFSPLAGAPRNTAAATTRHGALDIFGLTWQVRLEEAISARRPEPIYRIPAGLAVMTDSLHRAIQGATAGDPALVQAQQLIAEADTVPPRPFSATLFVDPRAVGQLSRLGHDLASPAHLGHEPGIIYYGDPVVAGLSRNLHRPAEWPATWHYHAWDVEPVPAGVWLHTASPPPGHRARAASINAVGRYRVIVTEPLSEVYSREEAWRQVPLFIRNLPPEVRDHLLLDFGPNLSGNRLALAAANHIVAGMTPEAIAHLVRLDAERDPTLIIHRRQTLDQLAAFTEADITGTDVYSPAFPVTVLAVAPGPLPPACNVRFVLHLSTQGAGTEFRHAGQMLAGATYMAIIPVGTRLRLGDLNVEIQDGRPIVEIHLHELPRMAPVTLEPAEPAGETDQPPPAPGQDQDRRLSVIFEGPEDEVEPDEDWSAPEEPRELFESDVVPGALAEAADAEPQVVVRAETEPAAGTGALFGSSITPRRRAGGDRPSSRLSLLLPDLPALLGRAHAYLGRGKSTVPQDLPEQRAAEGLAAVLAEAAGRRGAEPWWNAHVDDGLRILPLARTDTAYADSLPGIDPDHLAVDDPVPLTGAISAHSDQESVAAGAVLFVITSPAGRNVGGLVGGGSDLIMFAPQTRLRVVSIRTEASGRRVITLAPPAVPPPPVQ